MLLLMGEGFKQMTNGVSPRREEAVTGEERSGSTSFSGESCGSVCSSTSNLTDDAASPTADSSASSASSSTLRLDSGGPLYELSPLLAQLPIRRGLSKYYQGQSQSFTSLSDARCVEDLAKKTPYNRRMKTCKSYAGGLDAGQRSNHIPGPCGKTMAKKSPRSSFGPLLSRTSSASLLCSGKPPVYQSKKMYKA